MSDWDFKTRRWINHDKAIRGSDTEYATVQLPRTVPPDDYISKSDFMEIRKHAKCIRHEKQIRSQGVVHVLYFTFEDPRRKAMFLLRWM